MSRRLRFRAWDYKDKRMVNVCPTPAGPAFYDDVAKAAFAFNDGVVSEPMQFTGLRDANGVEIYEGDVLHWDGSIVGAVSFAHCEFIVGEGVNARAMCAIPSDAGEVEIELTILGNIHENPELLEGAQ